MPNEEYRICLGARDLNPSAEEVVNHWAREGFKVYAIDNLGCIHMKREVDEPTAPQMTIVDTTLTRPTALTERELVLYGMLRRDAGLDDAVYRYPAHLVSDIYHLVERLLMVVQSPPTPTRVQLETEVNDLATENVRLLSSLSECQQALAARDQALSEAMVPSLSLGPVLNSAERDLLATARRNWRDGVARYQDMTNLLEIIRRITGVTT